MDWLLYEKEAISKGYANVCGVDEAGRGPLAGPVYAAAVILPPGLEIEGVNDSKKLTEKKREALFPESGYGQSGGGPSCQGGLRLDRWEPYAKTSRSRRDHRQRRRTFYEHCLRLHFSQGNPGSCYDGMGSKVSPVSIRQA